MFGYDLQIWGDRRRCFSRAEEQYAMYAGPRAPGELIGTKAGEYASIVRLEVWQL
jgi:hypothetical protein